MIEFPTVQPSSKAPRKPCIGFDKLDGSNIRIKWTRKRGFDLFGSRTQLIDRSHPHLGEVVDIFNNQFSEIVSKILVDKFPNEREAIAFGEFKGEKSFAGIHIAGDPKFFYLFDILIGHKNEKFILPQDFVKLFADKVPTPKEIYRGNLNDSLIADVRAGKYNLFEGMLCKGTERSGAARGGVWMAKIKTQAYFDMLKARFGEEEAKKYGE